MNEYTTQTGRSQQRQAILRAFRNALLDKHYAKANAIRDANSDFISFKEFDTIAQEILGSTSRYRRVIAQQPDQNCWSLPDGSCVGTNCMHDPIPVCETEAEQWHPTVCAACFHVGEDPCACDEAEDRPADAGEYRACES